MTFAKRVLVGIAIALCCVGNIYQPASAMSEVAPTEVQGSQPLRDMFFYVCVHQYFKGESLDQIDASVAYVSEYVDVEFEQLMAVTNEAKAVAGNIRARQHPGDVVASGDWRRVPVLAICLNKSKEFKLPQQ
jgi:hypothetical protein